MPLQISENVLMSDLFIFGMEFNHFLDLSFCGDLRVSSISTLFCIIVDFNDILDYRRFQRYLDYGSNYQRRYHRISQTGRSSTMASSVQGIVVRMGRFSSSLGNRMGRFFSAGTGQSGKSSEESFENQSTHKENHSEKRKSEHKPDRCADGNRYR